MDLGKKLVDQGRYDAALAEFEKAFEERPSSSGAVFNIAYCLFRLERLEDARARFNAYIGMGPGKEKEEKARLYLDQIEKKLGDSAGKTPIDPVAAPRDTSNPDVWPWAAVATGGTIAVAGTIVYLVSLGQFDDANSWYESHPGDPEGYDQRWDDATDVADAGRWTLAAGAAVAAGGVAWLLLGDAPPAASPSPSSPSAPALLHLTF